MSGVLERVLNADSLLAEDALGDAVIDAEADVEELTVADEEAVAAPLALTDAPGERVSVMGEDAERLPTVEGERRALGDVLTLGKPETLSDGEFVELALTRALIDTEADRAALGETFSDMDMLSEPDDEAVGKNERDADADAALVFDNDVVTLADVERSGLKDRDGLPDDVKLLRGEAESRAEWEAVLLPDTVGEAFGEVEIEFERRVEPDAETDMEMVEVAVSREEPVVQIVAVSEVRPDFDTVVEGREDRLADGDFVICAVTELVTVWERVAAALSVCVLITV